MRNLLDEANQVHIYKKPVDMRKSYDGLYQLIKSEGIFKGGVFLFLSANRKRAKMMLWNKVGLMIIMQRLEEGKFSDILRRKKMTRDELLDFFEGGKTIGRNIIISSKNLVRKNSILPKAL